MKARKFVSWRRCSTQKQGKSGLGLEAQMSIINYFVNEAQGELIADFHEVYTGKNLHGCVELQKAMECAKKHNATLVVAKTDRFRNLEQALEVYRLMDGSIYFCDVPMAEDAATYKFMLSLSWSLAEREAAITALRTRQALQAKRERGEAGTPQSQEQQEELIVPIGLHTAQEQTTEVERLLIQNIIRHGDEIIYEGVETDDGQFINLNVAQYIDYDLGSDGLEFSNPLFNRILQEAVAHSGVADFKADLYFMQHPDPEISQLAANLGIDRHQLSRSFQVTASGTSLRQRIEHLILDFRMDIVSQHLKELQRKMKEVGSDMTQIKPLMDDYKQTQELRNALARQRGSDVIV